MKKAQKPRKAGWLRVSGLHEIYWQDFGCETGTPWVFLHGGPGCGFDPSYLALFDLKKVRLIVFDQRGCGRSRPLGALRNNTSKHLVQDIEALRRYLGIEKWYVAGHSWGTTLAIMYAVQFPSRVKGLLLAGFFAATLQSHLWCFKGARRYFPEAYEALRKSLPCDPSNAPRLLAFMKKASLSERERVACALSNYFRQIIYLRPPSDTVRKASKERLAMWKIFFHYAARDFDLDPTRGVYPLAARLKDIPITLVQGRYDMDCAPDQAFKLQRLLPQMRLKIVAGNHELCEDPMDRAYGAEARFLEE